MAANTLINATLRPIRSDSVDMDGMLDDIKSENIYVHRKNVPEVLKLLQETYLDKVKITDFYFEKGKGG